MKLIQLRKTFREVPEKWEEVTGTQLLRIMEVLYVRQYSAEQQVLRLLQVLTGMTDYQFFRCKLEELEEYFYLVAFLLQQPLTKQLLPQYEGFHGPQAGLANLVMDEFIFTEAYFNQWAAEKKDEAALNQLAAVLYRPAKEGYDLEQDPDGDPRITFNENLCAWQSRNGVANWPKAAKLAIAEMYAGCRQQWVTDNPDVFEGGDSDGEENRYGMLALMRNVAKDGAYGDFESVGKKYVNLILMELNLMVQEARRIEKMNPA